MDIMKKKEEAEKRTNNINGWRAIIGGTLLHLVNNFPITSL